MDDILERHLQPDLDAIVPRRTDPQLVLVPPAVEASDDRAFQGLLIVSGKQIHDRRAQARIGPFQTE